MVKAKNGNDIYLVCNIDESPEEFHLRHRDLQRIVIGPYSIEITAGGNTTKIEEKYTASFDFDGTTLTSSSPQFSYALDASEYQLFENKGAPTNITKSSLAYNLNVSDPTNFDLAVALQDSAHMQGEAKTTNGTLYKLAAPTVKDAIKDLIIQSPSVSEQNEIFIGINNSNQGQLTVDALDTVYYPQSYVSDPNVTTIDGLKNIITVKTKLAKATAYGESPTYDGPSESSDKTSKTLYVSEENLYHLQVQAQASGYLDSDWVNYYVTMQKTMYVDSNSGDNDNNGLKNNPLKTITKAIERAKILIPYTENDDNITCYLSGNFNENNLDTSLFDKGIWLYSANGRQNSLVLTKMPGEAQNPTIQGITIGQNTKVSDINFASNLTIADNQPFNITLTNVTFKECGISLNSLSGSTYVNALNLENVTMSGGDSGTGVNITDKGLRNLKINIKTTTIEKFETGINLSTGSKVTIENSTIQNCKRGIKVQGLSNYTATLTLTDTTIQNCNTTPLNSDNHGAGIYMLNFSHVKIGGKSKIIDNTTKDGSGAGIYLAASINNVLEICGNTIINGNKILSCTQTRGRGGAGIYNQGKCYIYGQACIGDPNAATAATEKTNFDSLSGNYVQAAINYSGSTDSKEYVYGGGIYNAGFLYLGARPSGDTELKDGNPKIMGNYCEGPDGIGRNGSGGGGIYSVHYSGSGSTQAGSWESDGMFAIYDCIIQYNGHPNQYRNGIYIGNLSQDIVHIKSSDCEIFDNVCLDAYGYGSGSTTYYYVGNINMGSLSSIKHRINLYLSSYAASLTGYDMVKRDDTNATLPGVLFLAKKEDNSPTNIATNDIQWEGKTDK
ncbi:MAG: right-handed parallel beta-helix repeat-containing protein [Spirochaetaceae bacterium]|nr:right-handed parallel beta-helix repeat-containing protein [Spirochaetaceae bacterium]